MSGNQYQEQWRLKAGSVFKAIIAVTIMQCIDAIMSAIGGLKDMGDTVNMIASGKLDLGPDMFDIMGYAVAFILVIGYICYMSSLGEFSQMQRTPNDTAAVGKIKTGAILTLWGILLGLIPFVGGFLGAIFHIIAFFVMLSGFGRMKDSPTFPNKARKGAGRLWASMIVGLVGSILSLIPFVGILLAGLFGIIAFFMMLSGWATIKNADVDEVEQTVQPSMQPATPSVSTVVVTDELRVKAASKTDEELDKILIEREDYSEAFIQAVKQERRARQEAARRESRMETETPISSAQVEAPVAVQVDSVPEKVAASLSDSQSEDKVAQSQSAEQTKEVESPLTNASSTVATPATPAKKTNTGLIVGIVVGLLVLIGGVAGYFVWYVPYAKDRDALRTYVMATNVFLRSSEMAGVEYNVLGKIPYGSELITYEKGEEWAHVKVNGTEGYMASSYLLEGADFTLLNSVWGDMDSRDCIESSKCRMAILDFYKQNKLTGGSSGWQIYTKAKNQKPNTVFYPRIYDKGSKFTDFFFVIKNNASGQRTLVGYSFEDETEKPIYRFMIEAPEDGYIQKVYSRGGNVVVQFDNYQNVTVPLYR